MRVREPFDWLRAAAVLVIGLALGAVLAVRDGLRRIWTGVRHAGE